MEGNSSRVLCPAGLDLGEGGGEDGESSMVRVLVAQRDRWAGCMGLVMCRTDCGLSSNAPRLLSHVAQGPIGPC